jgi:predicted SAM-dependent methyltransferase
MIAQRLKDVYYGTAGWLTAGSYWYFRLVGHRKWTSSSSGLGTLRLHLGSGRVYVDRPGYVNIDAHPLYRKDIWLDVRFGLPFPDCCVDAIYCSHMLEHFYEPDISKLLRECYRVLKPGGGVRLVTPHLGKAISAYVNGDKGYFSDFPDKRTSLGGRFVNHMLCRDQHRVMFDLTFMEECLSASGFPEAVELLPRQSRIFTQDELEVLEHETREAHSSLFVEARRISSSSQ